MGVYHLMGLGLSPGTVTGPLSYLARRYTRWSPDDERFFGRSGERDHREEGKKVGSVQAVVLFTSPEVLSGDLKTVRYVDNRYGTSTGAEREEAPMREVLPRLIAAEWRGVASGQNRHGGDCSGARWTSATSAPPTRAWSVWSPHWRGWAGRGRRCGPTSPAGATS